MFLRVKSCPYIASIESRSSPPGTVVGFFLGYSASSPATSSFLREAITLAALLGSSSSDAPPDATAVIAMGLPDANGIAIAFGGSTNPGGSDDLSSAVVVLAPTTPSFVVVAILKWTGC